MAYIIVAVVIVVLLISGLVSETSRRKRKSQNKQFQTDHQDQENYFEAQKKIWWQNSNKIVKVEKFGYTEIIKSFPMFTDFEQTTKYLGHQKLSSAQIQETLNLLTHLENEVQKKFIGAEKKLTDYFNQFSLVMNEDAVKYLTNYYLNFLEQTKTLTLRYLYQEMMVYVVNEALNGQRMQVDTYLKNKLSFFQTEINKIVSQITQAIELDLQRRSREAYEEFIRNFQKQSQNQNHNDQNRYYESMAQHQDSLEAAYKTLGLTSAVSDEELKKTYRKLAKEYHPDKNDSDSAKEKMMQINSAYTLIKQARNL